MAISDVDVLKYVCTLRDGNVERIARYNVLCMLSLVRNRDRLPSVALDADAGMDTESPASTDARYGCSVL